MLYVHASYKRMMINITAFFSGRVTYSLHKPEKIEQEHKLNVEKIFAKNEVLERIFVISLKFRFGTVSDMNTADIGTLRPLVIFRDSLG